MCRVVVSFCVMSDWTDYIVFVLYHEWLTLVVGCCADLCYLMTDWLMWVVSTCVTQCLCVHKPWCPYSVLLSKVAPTVLVPSTSCLYHLSALSLLDSLRSCTLSAFLLPGFLSGVMYHCISPPSVKSPVLMCCESII